jgi:NAD+ synthase
MMKFHKDILKIDCEKEIEKICGFIRQQTLSIRREGVVIGLSGGVDSALCSDLCVKALGREKVLGLLLPEKESNPISQKYALKQAQKLGIPTEIIDITSALNIMGTYQNRDHIVKQIFPEYESDFRIKITLPNDLLSKDNFNLFTLTMMDPKGNTKSRRLKKNQIQAIMAATNIKQRTRMIYLYFHAEKRNSLVCGTTNRSEYLQGFFVKYGDGGVDIDPIAHLYKTQVYQLSEHSNIIEEIRQRAPSPDTYSLELSDEEFYFRIPYDKLDLLLYAWENKIAVEEVCRVMDLTEEQVNRAFRDFSAKQRATQHLRTLPPGLIHVNRDA